MLKQVSSENSHGLRSAVTCEVVIDALSFVENLFVIAKVFNEILHANLLELIQLTLKCLIISLREVSDRVSGERVLVSVSEGNQLAVFF